MAYLENIRRLRKERLEHPENAVARPSRPDGDSLCESRVQLALQPELAVFATVADDRPRTAAMFGEWQELGYALPDEYAPKRKKTLTAEDLPMVRATLEQNGWVVIRRGDELICKPRPVKTEKPPGKRLLRRVLDDSAVADFVEHFDAEVVSVTNLKN